MANLTKIEHILSATALYTFEANPKVATLDQSWQRRSGTYTVIGLDYGTNPFGTYAAPIGTRKLQWGFRVVVPIGPTVAAQKAALDLAHDAVTRACMKRSEHLLCQSSGGAERVVRCSVVDFQDVTKSAEHWRHRDFTITWEMNGPWRERISRGPHRIGDTAGVLMGATPSLLLGAGSVALLANVQDFFVYTDGSDGQQATTVDDTGPIFTIHGPFGGATGFFLYNLAALALLADDNGASVNTYLYYSKPIDLNTTLVIDCGALAITDQNLVDQWANLTVPDYQPWWQVIASGTVNTFRIASSGAGAFVGATSTVGVAYAGLFG